MKLMGRRGLTATIGFFTLALTSANASAAPVEATFQPAVQNINYSLPQNSATGYAYSTPVQQLPLNQLVQANMTGAALDDEGNCLATAIYFESRGEPLEGQLAVADVVMNRAASGRYPSDWCGVVKQPAQFSFVHHGQFPAIYDAYAWQTAQAVARTAINNLAREIPNDVMWYHADYVAPSWRRSLQEVEQIGAHIFYRA